MELPRLPSGLIRFADVRDATMQKHLAAEVAAGRLQRVRRGFYADVPAESVPAWQRDELRHLRLVRAAAETMRAPMFTGFSALALFELPSYGAWPHEVSVLSSGPTGHRRAGVVAVGAPRPPALVRVGDCVTTSLEFTLIQVCRVGTLAAALVAVDAALWVPRRSGRGPRTTIERLRAEHERLLPYPGSRRTEAVLERATSRAETPFETASRLVIEEFGFEPPVLQQSFRLEELGTIAEVDFWWPSVRAIGEADGRGKYLSSAGGSNSAASRDLASGANGPVAGAGGAGAGGAGVRGAGTWVQRTAAESAARRVVREKDRENALRRRVRAMDRWDWGELARKHPVERRLAAMGVPRTRPRRALIGPPDAPALRARQAITPEVGSAP
ncbi:hypothetical protein [Agromyces lapidis]|uniref:Transcriptional regulator, AbiEi antitoxin, Type IV TA system n=1 Tax=Agromyces lapidis TaxID=279574 RepID=A0ABV5ST37_9MICO|nr:hypothetical protein [Agromyces lapidis]